MSEPDTLPRTHMRYYYRNQLRRVLARLIATRLSPNPGTVVVDFGFGEMPYRSLFPPQAGDVGMHLARKLAAQR